MHKLLIAVAAAAFAGSALAQVPPSRDPIEDEIARAMPSPGQVEAMAPVLDRSMGALMNMDVGPLMDAVDPYRRSPEYGRPGRTIGQLGRRDDPYFEQRLHSQIYAGTAQMGRMMGALSAATPALARSMREFERAIGTAVGQYEGGQGYQGYEAEPYQLDPDYPAPDYPPDYPAPDYPPPK